MDLIFVGSLNREVPYAQGARGKGIGVYFFERDTATARLVEEVGSIDNPTYLAVHPSNGCFYPVTEVPTWNEGTISAYRFDRATGALTYINKQATLGSSPAYCSFDRSGRFLLVANYNYGDELRPPNRGLVIFPIAGDGAIGPAVASATTVGSGPNVLRQRRSHAHCVVASPDNRFLLVVDLGGDALLAYPFESAAGTLGDPVVTRLTPGSGPRHLVFHPNGTAAFVVNELDSSVSMFRYDPATGTFELTSRLSTLPPDVILRNHPSGIQLTPDGRFVYCANRGHDTLACYAVDLAGERLELIGFEPTGGRTPRDHTIDAGGRFIFVCHQQSDQITIFEIDPTSGHLLATERPIDVGSPMCAKLGAGT